jgi:hypothetical protein
MNNHYNNFAGSNLKARLILGILERAYIIAFVVFLVLLATNTMWYIPIIYLVISILVERFITSLFKLGYNDKASLALVGLFICPVLIFLCFFFL